MKCTLSLATKIDNNLNWKNMKNEKALLRQLGLGAFYTTSTKNELPGYISEHLLISFLAGNSSKKKKKHYFAEYYSAISAWEKFIDSFVP